jgi:hypothetical protein
MAIQTKGDTGFALSLAFCKKMNALACLEKWLEPLFQRAATSRFKNPFGSSKLLILKGLDEVLKLAPDPLSSS